jgi:two-component system sensor histidine kinase/response regulator
VVTVASGAEALAALKAQNPPFDIVFMDWRMPDLDGLQTSRRIKSDETLAKQPAIVLVTAFGREEVREEAERLNLDGFLVKPVTKSMLMDTLVDVFALPELGGATTGAAEATNQLAGARLLLTEDNEINQQIAIELLEGVGARVTVANNGRLAVEKLFHGPQPPPFDVVLMDLQMPEMDGYQATRKIRSDARFAALPIIAMTAHATMEERQRCLAAGMNDHISKPIDPALLFETVGRYYQPPGATAVVGQASSLSGETSALPAPLDRQDACPTITGLDARDGLARVAGNRKLYLKLLRQFAGQQGPAVTQITEALAASDTALAERLAHTLKGVAGNIGAKAVQSAASQLEKSIRERAGAAVIETAKQSVASALDPLVAALQQAFPDPAGEAAPAPTTVAVDPAQTRAAAAQLTQLLAEFDPGAADFIEANQAALRPLFPGERWPQFTALVQGYAFAEAQAQLEQAVKSLT